MHLFINIYRHQHRANFSNIFFKQTHSRRRRSIVAPTLVKEHTETIIPGHSSTLRLDTQSPTLYTRSIIPQRIAYYASPYVTNQLLAPQPLVYRTLAPLPILTRAGTLTNVRMQFFFL